MKYSIVSYLFFFLIGALLLSSCQNRPKEVLHKKKMEQLLYDIYVAEATMENDYDRFNTPEKKEAYISRLFQLHGVTYAQWDTSLSWYSDRIDLYLQMNDSVKARLERARKETDAEMSRLAAWQTPDLRTLSPSYIPSYFSFLTSGPEKGFHFRLNETEVRDRINGDRFSFTFSVIGIPPQFPHCLSSLLTLEYGDTTICLPQHVTENRTYRSEASMYLAEDTLQSIYGYVHLNDSLNRVPFIQLYHISLGAETPDSAPAMMPPDQRIPVRQSAVTADSLANPAKRQQIMKNNES
ncbi:MAG: DUF4296 domain-containing protein [Proteiniphilum sp.]|nr:DUF4296 domain-containing protein [Proteiniphilum sp.]MDD4158260.1 DUF4296 domain-containing protein [Proteiniphilum sp.]